MKAVAVYLRVSTSRQDVKSQEPDLKAWLRAHGKGRKASWFRDTFTGATFNRPGMRKLEAAVRAGKVDTVVVWRLDRLGRTARETLAFLEDLDAAGWVGNSSCVPGDHSPTGASPITLNYVNLRLFYAKSARTAEISVGALKCYV